MATADAARMGLAASMAGGGGPASPPPPQGGPQGADPVVEILMLVKKISDQLDALMGMEQQEAQQEGAPQGPPQGPPNAGQQ